MAQDELELSRRDIAASKVALGIGAQQEQARALTAMKLADYRREREAVILKEEGGIEPPSAVE
jgi:hypothetical protein